MEPNMRIALIDPLEISPDELLRHQQDMEQAGHQFIAHDHRSTDPDVIVERAKDADVLIIANLPMGRDILERLPKLKLISVAFTGLDHIDMETCERRGIKVMNAAGYSTIPVAEYSIGMVLSVYRDTIAGDRQTRELKGRNGSVGLDLAGKTIGIVGTGTIGCHAAKLYGAFGCKLLGWSRSERSEFTDLGGEYLKKEDLLPQVDILSLHTPLNAETTHLIGSDELALMPAHAILVNCARGPVVDSQALAEALQQQKLGHACIDVFEMEPPLPSEHPLLHSPNTTLSPHIAYATREAFTRRAKIVFDNITQWTAS